MRPSHAVLLFLAVSAFAQAPTGEIRLQVKDSTGAGLGASGKITGPGLTRDFSTNPQGSVLFPTLPFGHYRIEISRTGFAGEVVDIYLKSAAPTEKSVTLPLKSTTT